MPAADTIFLFGPFRLVPAERALYRCDDRSDGAVRLHGRAFDLLLALVERAGEVVAKDELLARVWPQTFVEEGNLRVHVAALRKVLQDDSGQPYVDNVVGRGYSFVAPVRRHATLAAPPQRSVPASVPLLQQPRLFGRRDTLQRLNELLSQSRLVTVAGPGGMGKTSVALAAAARCAALGEPVHVLDMAPLADAAQLGGALAAVLGVSALAQDPVPGLLAHLRGVQALLVFDNCEHLIDAAAALAERLLHDTSGIRILATSREPLRAEGEWVHRLAPLALPDLPAFATSATPATSATSAAPAEDGALFFTALAASPAVQLFVERAANGMDGFRLTPGNAGCVAEICRRLDGIPLAIELAAGRADFFGVQGLAARLEDCFAVLTRGRRTALPRHQTLRATLDWSYDMLSPLEQAILRRLAVFRAPFGLDCAIDVVYCEQVSRAVITDSIASLAAKSLLSVDSGGAETLYRLLGTTRAYALDKLGASGELEWLSGRYAQHCCALMEQAHAAFDALPLAHWLARYGASIGHVRAVLDWALRDDDAQQAESGAARIALGLRLCAASATLWYQLSLMDEYRRRLEQAMRCLSCAGLRIDAGTEMRLQLALGHALVHVGGQADSRRRAAAFARALALAERLEDGAAGREACMAALWGCYTDALFGGDYQAALGYAERYGAAAVHSGELAQAAHIGHARMLARSMHYLGQQQRARSHVDELVRHPPSHRRHALHRSFQLDQHISTLAIQGRVLWLQGYPEQAAQVARLCVDDAMRIGHGISLCFALLLGCTVATWSGDLAAAARYTELMLEHSRRCALPHWHFWGEGFALAQRLLRDGEEACAPAILALHHSPYCGNLQVDLMATLHPRLLSARAIERAEAGRAGWSCAEVWRGWGESLRRGGAPEQAEPLFRRALAVAREQGAVAWELRAAISLARLWRAQGRGGEARASLLTALDAYSEGFQTHDVLLARALLSGVETG